MNRIIIPAAAAVNAGAPLQADAFDAFRATYPVKPLPQVRVTHADQIKEMSAADGLLLWSTASVVVTSGQQPPAPTITVDQDASKLLWAVEATRVPYAPENCAFGKTLQSLVIKHSNLTGGRGAHCAGEMVKIDANQIVINGQSGRYGPKSAAEMLEVAKAFRASGYNVWSMGYDTEAAKPLPFVGITPTWIP